MLAGWARWPSTFTATSTAAKSRSAAPDSDRAILAVLEAIRDTLAGESASSASVLLDGREYHMQGE
jgi:hypothetical protein